MRRFQERWKHLYPWIEQGFTPTSEIYCKYCNCKLIVKKYSLKQHEKTVKHKRAELLSKNSSTDSTFLSDNTTGSFMPVLSMSEDKEEIDVKPFRKVRKPFKATRRFQMYWLKKFPWLKRGQTDTARARCKYCDTYFMLKKSMFEQHERTSKHVKKKVQYEKGQPPSGYCDGIVSKCLELDDNEDDITLVSSKVMDREKGKPVYIRRIQNESCFSKEEKTAVANDRYNNADIRGTADLVGPGLHRGFTLPKPSKDKTDEVVKKVSDSFTSDVVKLLQKDSSLQKEALKRVTSTNSDEWGLLCLTKLVVGQMSQTYLSENVNDLWKMGPSTVSRDSIPTQMAELEQQLNESYTELQNLQSQINSEDMISPAKEIIIEGLDFDI